MRRERAFESIEDKTDSLSLGAKSLGELSGHGNRVRVSRLDAEPPGNRQ
jgi:hypothetical protein